MRKKSTKKYLTICNYISWTSACINWIKLSINQRYRRNINAALSSFSTECYKVVFGCNKLFARFSLWPVGAFNQISSCWLPIDSATEIPTESKKNTKKYSSPSLTIIKFGWVAVLIWCFVKQNTSHRLQLHIQFNITDGFSLFNKKSWYNNYFIMRSLFCKHLCLCAVYADNIFISCLSARNANRMSRNFLN